MNKPALISAITAFVISFGGAVLTVTGSGNTMNATAWIIAIVFGAMSSAKDLRSLYNLPPVSDAGDLNKPTKPGGGMMGFWLLIAVLAISPVVITGCGTTGQNKPTALALAYYTLADTKSLVDGAEKVYGRACALDQISAADQVKVDDAIVKFHASFKLAVRAARADFSAITPAEVQKLADSLLALIEQFAPPPN